MQIKCLYTLFYFLSFGFIVLFSNVSTASKVQHIFTFEKDERGNLYPVEFVENLGHELKPKDNQNTITGDYKNPENNIKIHLPLVTNDPIQVVVPEKKENRVMLGLSIDGGGTRGLMPAIWLQELEQKVKDKFGNKKRIYDVYDSIGGTSVGGILALGIASGKNECENLVKIFDVHAAEIFPKNESQWWIVNVIGGLFKSIKGLSSRRYDHNPLQNILKKYLGETRMVESKTEILVTTCATNGQPYLLSNYNEQNKMYGKLKMWEVGRATSAAPTYFEAHQLFLEGVGSVSMIDGGVWANNPSTFVGGSLLKKTNYQPQQVSILSLGTGECRNKRLIPDNAGIKDASPILDAFMTSHSRGNHLAMQTFFQKYTHINPIIEGDIQLDNTEKKVLEELKTTAKKQFGDLSEYFKKNHEFMRLKLESGNNLN